MHGEIKGAVFFVARLPRIIILRGMVNHPELEGWAMLWRSIAIRQ